MSCALVFHFGCFLSYLYTLCFTTMNRYQGSIIEYYTWLRRSQSTSFQGWSHWPSCSSTSFYISTYRLPYPFVPTKTMAGSLKTWRESYKTIGFFLDLLQSIHINAGSPRYPVWIHLLWKNPCSDIEFNFPKQCYQSCLICLEVYQGAIPVETFFLKQGKNGGNFKEPFSVRT